MSVSDELFTCTERPDTLITYGKYIAVLTAAPMGGKFDKG